MDVVSRSIVMEREGIRRLALCTLLAIVLMLASVPQQAYAYFNRGSVSVDLGTTSVQVEAGGTVNVTVSITPSSDEQTEGCGMPLCPQGCSPSCADENGQCTCAGTEYRTYYPTATATSSDAGVATASYENGVLTVYGRSQGEATITVTASLRQFTDDEATINVKVEGEAPGYQAGSDAFVETPEIAEEAQGDRLDYLERIVMKRPIHYVRINENCDAAARLTDMAGIDGDVIFWSGDSYFQPDYSLTFKGVNYAQDDVFPIDATLQVTTQAEGSMNQPLAGLSGFLVVDFAQKGSLPAPTEVYAFAQGVLNDNDSDAVALYSFDDATKEFVAEDVETEIVGGYAKFTVSEGKTYVVSKQDLTQVANQAVSGGASQAGDASSAMQSQPPLAGVVIGVAAVIVVAIVIAAVVRSRKRKAASASRDEDVAATDKEGE